MVGRAGHDGQELVAADAGGRRRDRRRQLRSAPATSTQHVVADAVAAGVVDRLEAVEVDVEHAGGAVLHLGLQAVEGRPTG